MHQEIRMLSKVKGRPKVRIPVMHQMTEMVDTIEAHHKRDITPHFIVRSIIHLFSVVLSSRMF